MRTATRVHCYFNGYHKSLSIRPSIWKRWANGEEWHMWYHMYKQDNHIVFHYLYFTSMVTLKEFCVYDIQAREGKYLFFGNEITYFLFLVHVLLAFQEKLALTKFWACKSAPFSNNSLHVSLWPPNAARCNGVSLYCRRKGGYHTLKGAI